MPRRTKLWWAFAALDLVLLAMLASAASAQTTQPADALTNAIASVQGVFAQQQQQLAATQLQNAQLAVTVAQLQAKLAAPTARPLQVEAGTDLAPLLAKATGNVYLGPGPYPWNGSLAFKNDGVRVIGDRTKIIFNPAKGASTGATFYGRGWSFVGCDFFTSVPGIVGLRPCGWQDAAGVVHPSDLTCFDCTFSPDFGNGVHPDTWGDNVTLLRCTFGTPDKPMLSDNVYTTADNTAMLHCRFYGSIGDHCARVERNGTTGHRASNVLTFKCEFSNYNSANKLECFTGREEDGSIHVADLYHGFNGHGQGPDDGTWHSRSLFYRSCVWTDKRPGGALVQLEHDSTAFFDACSFPASLTDASISIDGRGLVETRGNVLVGATAQSKPLAIAFGAAVVRSLDSIPTSQPSTNAH
jgi:hypothetical protein